ncbi:MAG: potassium transporter TrkG [Chitinophagales bacterium]
MINIFKRLKEGFNIFLFDNQKRVKEIFFYFTLLACVVVSACIVVYYGFEHSPERLELLQDIIKVNFLIFLSNYLIRLFFSFERLNFLRTTKFEGFLMLLLFYELLSQFFYEKPLLDHVFQRLNIEAYESFYVVFTQLYILLFIAIQLIKYLRSAVNLNIKPSLLFVLSFLGVIFIGSALLMLPEMTVQEGSMRYVDAFFTSVSATCITGLVVVDTATFFTVKGQAVILLLMQLGGIGIISFASFFAFFLKKGLSFRHQTVLQDFFSEDSLDNSKSLIRQIFFFTFSIEALGIFLIYFLWSADMAFSSVGEKVFFSVFHGVSAFCNSGFVILENGLMAEHVANNYILHIVLGVLIFMGALGFPAMRDILSIQNLRARLKMPWKQWKLSTTVAVYASVILVAFGMLFFWALEKDAAMKGMNFFEMFVTSFFQSVTTRSGGLNTVNIAALSVPTLVIFIFLMFVGGSSGGTGGGIKTSTFFLIMLSVRNTITGRNQLQFKRRNISYSLLNRAYALFIFSSFSILFGIFVLTLTEDADILAITFEAVSAFATVGLSMGLTPDLSDVGKIVISLGMFSGRVGLLTFAFALSTRVKSNNYRYPNTNMMVG